MRKMGALLIFLLIVCSANITADQIRLSGKVQLWDKTKMLEADIEKLINSGVSAQVSLDVNHSGDSSWILDDNEITPQNDGKWQTFAQYNGDEIDRRIFMTGKIGEFFSPEPHSIPCKKNQGHCGGTLILRSPSNAAAWKFDLCLQSIKNGGSTPTIETISCLKDARNYSEKEVISLQLADVYSKDRQYGACFDSFNAVANKTTSEAIRESAITNAAECQEKAALLEFPQIKKFESLSEYIRFAFNNEQVTRTKSTFRQMLLRRWFDAFNKRLSPDGDLELLVSKVISSENLVLELDEIYFYYFHSENKFNFIDLSEKEKIKKKIKNLGEQWYRYYK